MNADQQQQLQQLFMKHENLFDGTLGLYRHKEVRIEVMPNAQPKHQRPSAFLKIYWETFEKKLQHLIAVRVLSPQGMSSWANPSFIIPEKDGRVR